MLITFAAKAQTVVTYFDEYGDKQTHEANKIDVDVNELSSGWYYVESFTLWANLNIPEVTISGNVYLIFGTSSKLTISKLTITEGSSFTIYRYTNSELVFNTIAGGGTFIVNSVKVTGTSDVSTISGVSIIINDGELNVSEISVNELTINSGVIVSAKTSAKNITLSWNSESDKYQLGTLSANTLEIADGKVFVIDGKEYSGTIDATDIAEFTNQTLTPPTYPVPNITLTPIAGIKYDGEPHQLLTIAYPDGEITDGQLLFSVDGDDTEWSSLPMATNIGNHSIKYKIISNTPKYVDSESKSYEGEVEITAIGSSTVDGIYYVILDDDNVQVGDGKDCAWPGTENPEGGKITIPANVSIGGKTYTVSKIGDNAFNCFKYGSVLKEVDFAAGNSIKTIGANAFSNNTALKKVNLDACKELTTIGGSAFAGSNGFESITIPSKVKVIGNYAFSSCGGLKSVTIAEGSVLETIGDYAFYYTSLTQITLPASVKSIGSGALRTEDPNFQGFTLTCHAIVAPSLGTDAFSDKAYVGESILTVPLCGSGYSEWKQYFEDFTVINVTETSFSESYSKEYDGTAILTYAKDKRPKYTYSDGVNSFSITSTAVTFFEKDQYINTRLNQSPSVGKGKLVKVTYDMSQTTGDDVCTSTGNVITLSSTDNYIEFVDDVYIPAKGGSETVYVGVKSDDEVSLSADQALPASVGITYNTYDYEKGKSYTFTTNNATVGENYKLTSTNSDYPITINLHLVGDAYAVYDGSTLTFKVGDKSSEQTGATIFDIPTDNDPDWQTYNSTIENVVFDPSFDFARPVTCYKWFSGCENLTEITGMEYLHTDNVTDMSYMFNHCEALQMVDLSKFNTSNVTNMESMFAGCIKMRMLDLTSFNTEKVTNMKQMFYLNTTLTPYSTSLEVIYVGDGWKTGNVTSHGDMFYRNDKLEGGNGTKFDGTKALDKTFAKIDGGTADPGYLTGIANYGYAVFKDNTLTFKQGSKPAVVDGELFELTQSKMTFEYNGNNRTDVRPTWYNKRADIKSVVFDDGFQNVIVRNCNYWFDGCTNLASITNLTKLNTSQVTEMSYMFSDCAKLGTIDLSGFNTQNVYDFRGMFQGCKGLTSLDVSHITFNLTKYPNNDNTYWIKVDAMFANSGLTSINLSSWASTPLSSYAALFQNCENLVSVDVTDIVTSETKSIDYMFFGCSKLGTDTEHPLDVSSFNTENVTDMSYLFDGCTGLQSIDVSKFKTAKVTDMSYMFDDCSSLSVLDISNFNTEKVTNMDFMFADCHKLTTIKVGSNWNTKKAASSNNMFQGDYNLIGNYGAMVDVSKYGSSPTNDVAKANCTEQGGYLTTGNYKIFYDLDKDDDDLILASVDPLAIQNGTASTEYAGGSVVSLPTLKARDDDGKDAFKGWHRATRDSEGNMTFATDASTTIASNEVGNRIYAAEWTFTMGKYVLYDADTKTLTFHFDTKKPKTGAYSLNEGAVAPDWLVKSSEIEKVIIADPIKPTSCYQWFKGFSKLTALDLRNLNTSNVTDMTSMFNGCSSLTGILIGDDWSTDKVTESDNMFTGCTSLIGEGGEFASQYGYEDKTNAYAEDEYGNGYLTKDNFKIFYTLNDIEENGDDGNATFSNGSDANSMIVPCSDDEATTLETPTWTNHIFSGWSKVTAYIYNSESDSYDYVYDTEEPLHQKSVSPGSGNWALMGLWDKNHTITLPGADWKITDEFGRDLPKDSNANPTAPIGAKIIIEYQGSKVVKEVEVETN